MTWNSGLQKKGRCWRNLVWVVVSLFNRPLQRSPINQPGFHGKSHMMIWVAVSDIFNFHPNLGKMNPFWRAYFSDAVETYPPLKLTAFSPLKLNGWKMKSFQNVSFRECHSWATKDDQFPIVTQVREVPPLELKIGVPKISSLSKEMLSLSHRFFFASICNFYRCNRSPIFSKPKRCFGLWYSESRTLKKFIWQSPS